MVSFWPNEKFPVDRPLMKTKAANPPTMAATRTIHPMTIPTIDPVERAPVTKRNELKLKVSNLTLFVCVFGHKKRILEFYLGRFATPQ